MEKGLAALKRLAEARKALVKSEHDAGDTDDAAAGQTEGEREAASAAQGEGREGEAWTRERMDAGTAAARWGESSRKQQPRLCVEPGGAQWARSTTNKSLSTLSKLARQGQLSQGDMQMAELYTGCDDAVGLVDGAIKGVTVDGAVFARDRSRIRHWDITVQGLSRRDGGNNEVYVGSISFPPDYPVRPPVLLYAERKGALPLCLAIIKNARIMNGWDDRVWGDNDLVSEVDESLELDLVPKLDKDSGAWRPVYWSQYITVQECLENLRDFLHRGLKHLQQKDDEELPAASAARSSPSKTAEPTPLGALGALSGSPR